MAGHTALAGGPVGKRDTLPAVVLYGEELLFDVVTSLHDEEVLCLRDSLLAGGQHDFVQSIDLYLRLKNEPEEKLAHYLDSVFDSEQVPYALINQITLFIANRPAHIEPVRHLGCYVGRRDEPTPATEFYPVWDATQPNPYPVDLGATDTALSLLLATRGEFAMPVVNTVTSKFGWRDGRMHQGVDIDLQVWDPVVAAFPGVVRMARTHGGFGRLVVIRHYNGLETFYAHLHRFKVKEGDRVEAGQCIGLGGSSGHSTGSHLHFEVRFRGVPINPHSFISFDEGQLVNDTLQLRRLKTGYVAYPKGTLVHTVKRGDTLFDLAKYYGTTTYRIAELNGIRRNDYLRVGQRLRVI